MALLYLAGYQFHYDGLFWSVRSPCGAHVSLSHGLGYAIGDAVWYYKIGGD